MWYTCINHVRVVGKPLYNFVPALGCQPCGAEGAPSTGAAALAVAWPWLLQPTSRYLWCCWRRHASANTFTPEGVPQ